MRLTVSGAAAFAVLASPAALATVSAPVASAQPCYNGVIPWAPFVQSCTLPGPVGPRVRDRRRCERDHRLPEPSRLPVLVCERPVAIRFRID